MSSQLGSDGGQFASVHEQQHYAGSYTNIDGLVDLEEALERTILEVEAWDSKAARHTTLTFGIEAIPENIVASIARDINSKVNTTKGQRKSLLPHSPLQLEKIAAMHFNEGSEDVEDVGHRTIPPIRWNAHLPAEKYKPC